jgi:hypothetical protein
MNYTIIGDKYNIQIEGYWLCFRIFHIDDVRDALMLNDCSMLNKVVPSVNMFEDGKIGRNFRYLTDDRQFRLLFYIQKILSEIRLPEIDITF